MPSFKHLLNRLYEGYDISERIEEAKNNVSSKIDRFAKDYLSPDVFRRYKETTASLQYQVSTLPSTLVVYYDALKQRFSSFLAGVLGYYDMLRNRIVLNRYIPKEEIEGVLVHERVHQATRYWALEYFKRFGEAARPVIEGVTELITRNLGYYTKAYDEYVKAARDTLGKLGRNARDTLYDIINFRISPERVLSTFYSCANLYR